MSYPWSARTDLLPLRVLLVSSEAEDPAILDELLRNELPYLHVDMVTSVNAAIAAIDAGLRVDVSIIDLTDKSVATVDDVSRWAHATDGFPTVTLIDSSELALGDRSVEAGAHDYLLKGHESGAAIARAIRFAIERSQNTDVSDPDNANDAQTLDYERVEAGLIPTPLLRSERLSFSSRYVAARAGALGGDFIDCVQVNDRYVRIVVGDVAGHGSDQAAMGAILRVGWRTLVLDSPPERDVLRPLGALLRSERKSPNDFVTVTDLVVDLGRLTMTVRCAGHPPPFLVGSGIIDDSTRQRPLGIEPLHQDSPGTVHQVEPGFSVVVFTDGLFEQRGSDGTMGTIDDVPDIFDRAGPNPTVDQILLCATTGIDAWRDDVAIARLTLSAPT